MACKKKARQGGSTGSVMRKKKDEKSEMRQVGSIGKKIKETDKMRQGGGFGGKIRKKKTSTKK